MPGLAVLLIVVGLILWLTVAPGIGFVLLIVGLVLLVLGFFLGGRTNL